MDNKTIKILNYFSNFEKKEETPNLDDEISDLEKTKIKNILELSIKNDIKLFDEKKNYKIKSKRNIIKECNNHKEDKINNFVHKIDKSKKKKTSKIKILNDEFLKELESLESMITVVNNNDFKLLKNISESNICSDSKNENTNSDILSDSSNKDKDIYIEIFSNDSKID